jgi:hypothetical protein
MTVSERGEFARKFLEDHCLSVLAAKGKEYGSGGEPSANLNFHAAAEDIGSEAVDHMVVAQIYMQKHWRAVQAWLRNRRVQSNEPIQSRIGDLINYLLIIASMIEEDTRAKTNDLDLNLKTIAGVLELEQSGVSKMAHAKADSVKCVACGHAAVDHEMVDLRDRVICTASGCACGC